MHNGIMAHGLFNLKIQKTKIENYTINWSDAKLQSAVIQWLIIDHWI